MVLSRVEISDCKKTIKMSRNSCMIDYMRNKMSLSRLFLNAAAVRETLHYRNGHQKGSINMTVGV